MFCRQCGSAAQKITPAGDNRVREVCTGCGAIHYENPKMVVGTLPIWQENDKDYVLLCKRAIEPRYGCWTLPAGFMELGETTAEGAIRETVEEAGAQAKLGQLLTVIDVKQAGQVHFFYLARLNSTEFVPCPDETLETKLFSEDEVPWQELSFDTVKLTLQYYFAQRRWRALEHISTYHTELHGTKNY
jgi:ADP-ribose pyrophosphatase YjhB (NUDIX family)